MFFGEGSLLFISCNLTPGFTSLCLFRLKELLCLLRPRQKYPQKSLAPMCQKCDNACDVKQHSTANGPEREFARDARAQIRGVMDPLSVLEHQVMVGNWLALHAPKHSRFNIVSRSIAVLRPCLGLGLACSLAAFPSLPSSISCITSGFLLC